MSLYYLFALLWTVWHTLCIIVAINMVKMCYPIRHFSLLNVNVAGACGYDFRCDGGRLVRAYLRR